MVIVPAERSVTKLDAKRLEKRLSQWKNTVQSACEQCARSLIPNVQYCDQLQIALIENKSERNLVLAPAAQKSFYLGNSQSVTFAVETPAGVRGFRLPANVEGVRGAFAKQRVKAPPEQAERTAWRNVRDWIMAQMAILEAGMVQLDEVFLPYLVDNSGATLYQAYTSGLLLSEYKEQKTEVLDDETD